MLSFKQFMENYYIDIDFFVYRLSKDFKHSVGMDRELRDYFQVYLPYHGMTELEFVLFVRANNTSTAFYAKSKVDGEINDEIFTKPVKLTRDDVYTIYGTARILIKNKRTEEIVGEILLPTDQKIAKMLKYFEVVSDQYTKTQGKFSEFMKSMPSALNLLNLNNRISHAKQMWEKFGKVNMYGIEEPMTGTDIHYFDILKSLDLQEKFLEYVDRVMESEKFKKASYYDKLQMPTIFAFLNRLLVTEEEGGTL